MILCDTNILIELYKNNGTVIEAIKRIGPSNLAVSVVTEAELYFGALNKAELRQIQQHLSLLTRFHITLPISELFLMLMAQYSLSHSLAIPDALIAATAIHQDIPLMTLNVKDFRFIPKLELQPLD